VKWLLLTGASLMLAGPAFGQDDPGAHDAAPMPGMAAMPGMAMDMSAMESALGPYRMTRDASGTSWQPDASHHDGLMAHRDGWTLMGHALFNGVYDTQSGPRGAGKAFVSGMVMGQASHSLGEGNAVQFKAMFSPDPAMGPSGYPLLLATGETADGKTHLVDRQHPHDLVMELSGALSHQVGTKDSLFVYAGLPGEPAFGPPAFMHRMAAMDSPEAPITHHWLDSTHITFGVVTAGWAHWNWKLEVSAFKGREPDQHRWDIESPKLDSQAVRLSWNPTANWSLQGSWAHLNSPEQLAPANNEDRWSASALYTRSVGQDGWFSVTGAFGAKRLSEDGRVLSAWLGEAALKPSDPWTVFARAEQVQNEELLADHRVFNVGKVSLGVIRDWRTAPHVKIGLGALQSFALVPSALDSAYGSTPAGTMAFVRLKLN
jgi:hypothetical protein